ncbi:hypothetical protein NE609_04660 [Anaerotruncus sp. DFI.9.16]|nr:hypothetical protein [Anaerotruncus sp. DFI.9.16]
MIFQIIRIRQAFGPPSKYIFVQAHSNYIKNSHYWQMNFKKTKKESLPFFSTLAAGNKGKNRLPLLYDIAKLLNADGNPVAFPVPHML